MHSEFHNVLSMLIGDADGKSLNYMIFQEGASLASRQRRGRQLG